MLQTDMVVGFPGFPHRHVCSYVCSSVLSTLDTTYRSRLWSSPSLGVGGSKIRCSEIFDTMDAKAEAYAGAQTKADTDAIEDYWLNWLNEDAYAQAKADADSQA